MEVGRIGKSEIVDCIGRNLLSEEDLLFLEANLNNNVNVLPAKCQKVLMEQSVYDAVDILNGGKL